MCLLFLEIYLKMHLATWGVPHSEQEYIYTTKICADKNKVSGEYNKRKFDCHEKM